MTWLSWLALAVVVGVAAAVTGIKPRGSRPVARTRLMGIGRFVLLLLIAVIAYLVLRARAGAPAP
jgi:hypothetical protein